MKWSENINTSNKFWTKNVYITESNKLQLYHETVGGMASVQKSCVLKNTFFFSVFVLCVCVYGTVCA